MKKFMEFLHEPVDIKNKNHLATLSSLVVLIFILMSIPLTVILTRNSEQVNKTTKAAGSVFITRNGTNLILNGSNFTTAGYNWRWSGYNCTPPTTTDIDTVFGQIQTASKAKLLRTAFYQAAYQPNAVNPWQTFDNYIAGARAHGIYLVPILTNEWGPCEPSGTQKYLPWYQTGYTSLDTGYTMSYRDWAAKVAAHYATEPNIAWWQLVNEPDARNSDGTCTEATAASTMRSFADSVTGLVKAGDPNHMVDLGSISWCGGQGADFQMVNSGSVDLVDVYHDYTTATNSFPNTLLNQLNAAKALNKPTYIGEAGICADVAATGVCTGTVSSTSLNQRATFFNAKINAALIQNGISAYLIWTKSSSASSGWNVGPGDPTETVVASYNGGPTPPPKTTTSLWCEAENGSLVSPMVKGVDTAASNGVYIYSTVTDSTNVPPTTTGSATLTVNVPVAGTYTFWTRVNYGGEFQNSYYLQVDGGNTYYKVGNENTGYGVWKWVNWQNGDTGTTNIITLNFTTTGNHTLKIIGREANTLIDKILLTTDSTFVPTGTGSSDNCSGSSSTDTTPPTVSITSPTNGSTVSGSVSVAASASDNVGVTKVELYADGTLVGTDTATPYNFTWNSTVVINGSHTLAAKAYDAAGNVGTSASDIISVSNGDTTPPSTPTNLTATSASATQVNLNWAASTDNVGVTGYYIVRGGTTIATSSTNSFSDTSVSPSTSYSYNVIAYDAAANYSGLSNTANVSTPALPDTTPPTAPANLAATAVSSSQTNLTWTASTDNVGVVGYDIYRNSAKIGSATSTSFGDTGLTASTTYSYYVVARDAAGNSSSASNTATATTQPPPAATGAITGTVSSSLGGTLAYATITITVGGANQTYTANSSGSYVILNLAPATYSVKYSAKRYVNQTISITVPTGTTVTQNVTLVHR